MNQVDIESLLLQVLEEERRSHLLAAELPLQPIRVIKISPSKWKLRTNANSLTNYVEVLVNPQTGEILGRETRGPAEVVYTTRDGPIATFIDLTVSLANKIRGLVGINHPRAND